MGHTDDDEFEITHAFFKGISTAEKSYLCDFYHIKTKDGEPAYRVLLQSSGQKDITIDIAKTEHAVWDVVNSGTEIPAELKWKLIVALIDSFK